MLAGSREVYFYFALFKNMMLDVVSKNVILPQYKAIAPHTFTTTTRGGDYPKGSAPKSDRTQVTLNQCDSGIFKQQQSTKCDCSIPIQSRNYSGHH